MAAVSPAPPCPSDELEFQWGLLPFRKYKDGRIERLLGEDFVPPSDDLDGVSSKDVVIDPDTGVSARLYLPRAIAAGGSKEEGATRYPVVVYFHGGGFCTQTPFSAMYHFYLNDLVSKAKVLAVSVHYRRATEHLLPAAYDDCGAALRWVLSHGAGDEGPDPWLNASGDLRRVYLAGDSAGANIAHNVAMRFEEEEATRSCNRVVPQLEGIALVHPFFWGREKLPHEVNKFKPDWLVNMDRMWTMVSGMDADHPWLNATAEGAPSLARLGSRRVLVAVAAEDIVGARGILYHDKLSQSGWVGDAELWVTPGEFHIFHLFSPRTDNSKNLMDKLVSFFNHGQKNAGKQKVARCRM